MYLTVKLLLPGVIKSVYNLNDKQIVKLFSRIFNCNSDDMARDLEQVRGRGGSVDSDGPLLSQSPVPPFFLVGACTVLGDCSPLEQDFVMRRAEWEATAVGFRGSQDRT